jgi:hypothetical protein
VSGEEIKVFCFFSSEKKILSYLTKRYVVTKAMPRKATQASKIARQIHGARFNSMK